MNLAQDHIQQSKESFKGAEACFLHTKNTRGTNTGQLLCLSVEHALKGLVANTGEKPPKGHNLTYLVQNHLTHIDFGKHMEIIYTLDGMYTMLRYDSDVVVNDLDEKLTKGKNFIEFAEAHIKSKH